MVIVDQSKCIQCELCVKDCVDGLMRNKKGQIVGPKECLECGHCVAVCPKNAISIEGYDLETGDHSGNRLNIAAEDFLDLIQMRRSIRQYKDTKVPEKELGLMMEAVRYTATAKNAQANTVVFVQDQLDAFKKLVWDFIEEKTAGNPADLDAAWSAYFLFNMRHKKNPENDYLFRNAPSIVVIATQNQWDAGLAAQNIENMANTLGMGVLYNGYLARLLSDHDEAKAWLGISDLPVAAVLLLGYPSVKYQRSVPRKPLNLIRR